MRGVSFFVKSCEGCGAVVAAHGSPGKDAEEKRGPFTTFDETP